LLRQPDLPNYINEEELLEQYADNI